MIRPADYYYFPWGGGIISDAPAIIRRGYGDHAALYQLMDLFSPSRGAGLAIRSTDEDGRYKVLALRKHVPGWPETNGDAAETPTSRRVQVDQFFDAGAGTEHGLRIPAADPRPRRKLSRPRMPRSGPMPATGTWPCGRMPTGAIGCGSFGPTRRG